MYQIRSTEIKTFVNQKIFSIFVVGKQSEKVFEYQTEKEEAQGEKERIIVLTWAD